MTVFTGHKYHSMKLSFATERKFTFNYILTNTSDSFAIHIGGEFLSSGKRSNPGVYYLQRAARNPCYYDSGTDRESKQPDRASIIATDNT